MRIQNYQQHLKTVTSKKLDTSFKELHSQLSELHEAASAEAGTQREIMVEWKAKLNSGSFQQALNEMLALFTPVRWAYEDLSHEYDEDKGSLSVETDGIAVDKLLNTAELNTLTLACFLLCAPRVETRLRMLILDDSLQNMDEMTVTTIARGIGRLMTLWKRTGLEDWRLVIMLHGEENIERFRREIPCAVYFLPWLSPAQNQGKDNPPEIHVEESRYKKLLHIRHLVEGA